MATWEGAPMSFSSNMLNAVARLDNAFGDKMNDTTFKEKVGRVSVREIGRQARERRGGSLGFAEAILIAYNKKSKHPLRMDTLYAYKAPRGKKTEIETSEDVDTFEDDMIDGQLAIFTEETEGNMALLE